MSGFKVVLFHYLFVSVVKSTCFSYLARLTRITDERTFSEAINYCKGTANYYFQFET